MKLSAAILKSSTTRNGNNVLNAKPSLAAVVLFYLAKNCAKARNLLVRVVELLRIGVGILLACFAC